MKKTKAIISVLLSVLILLSVFSSLTLVVNAESDSPTFVVETVEAEKGEKNVAVTISIINNPGIASAALDIHYDENALNLADFIYNTDALGGASTVPYNNTAKPPCISMVDGSKNVTGDFVFVTLYFDVAKNAIGSYNITITYDEDNVYDIDETNVSFQTVGGKIIVSETENTKPAFVVSNTTVEKGAKNVPVSVMVKNNPGVASIALDIIYDHDILTLKDFIYNTDALNGASTVPFNPTANPPCLSVVNGTVNMENDFTIATLYFDLSDTARGDCKISLLYDEDNVYDINESNIMFVVNSGIISILESSPTVATETDPTEPSSSESQPTEPSSSESQPTEPSSSESQPTEPGSSEPQPTEPVSSETQPAETQVLKTDISNWKVSGIRNRTYTGKVLKQGNIIVSKNGEYADFTVKYRNNLNVGTATVIISGIGEYTGTITKTFKITKAKNPVTVKGATKTVMLSKIKKAKQTVKPITVNKAQGKVTYKLTSIPKTLKKLVRINSKGVITIRKWAKAKKGTYKIKIKITAKGSKNYNKRTITKTVKIVIK